ncbi:uncharacterized protein EV420DRAFT_209411 [Desarmillaria tabescens]|uniref:AB hydrolase-1 domain-containing protein n=1 Tax=Armillaria tabescens TaxID=1929756 RepID=A0AA39KGJ5_ARMTA|nr:uncharacterized protein EV420DRAFT_209411 [Desarmillaria tabescens]KAK0460403.1 hypothetical protein EV420DRAFT_209411 [Desarmillaria tabescens]
MSYTTGVGPVDDNGTVLFFTDSGPVPGSTDYTTVVIFHGSAFTGHTFHKLLPMAGENNLRLVILNRRDYAGSTKYTDEELAELREGKTEFLQRLGSESAYFLAWFVKTHDIPKIGTDGKSGGLATVGWSLGTTTPLSILSHPEVIPSETYDALEPYFRQMIFYDPPHLAFGYDQPPEGYNPFTDPELKTAEEIFANFGYWVSTYYDHPDLASRSPSGLDFSKRGTRPSIENMTPDDMKVTFDGEAAGRMEFPMYFPPMQPTIRKQTETALYDEEAIKKILPKLEIVHQFCTASNWYCVWGFFGNELFAPKRPIRFIEIPGANHFVHWDDPKAYMEATVKGLTT